MMYCIIGCVLIILGVIMIINYIKKKPYNEEDVIEEEMWNLNKIWNKEYLMMSIIIIIFGIVLIYNGF